MVAHSNVVLRKMMRWERHLQRLGRYVQNVGKEKVNSGKKQKIVEFLKNANSHIASIPMLAKAIKASPPTTKSIVGELEVEKKVRVKVLGGVYVVQLKEEVNDYE